MAFGSRVFLFLRTCCSGGDPPERSEGLPVLINSHIENIFMAFGSRVFLLLRTCCSGAPEAP